MEDCSCSRNWIKRTDNWFTTDTNISYNVYICENCKRYYVKRLGHFIEVAFDHDKLKWYQVADGKRI
jgi:hypothetical protein